MSLNSDDVKEIKAALNQMLQNQTVIMTHLLCLGQ